MADIMLVCENADIVDYFLQNDFSSFSDEDKLFVVKHLKRPCPLMRDLMNIKQDSTLGSSYRAFNIKWYEKYVWLTGSPTRNKLFCWNCLLFGERNKSNPWNTIGYDNLKALYRTVQRHTISKEHLQSTLKLKLFGKQSIIDEIDHKEATEKYNNLVRKNREILKRLVDMIIYLATQNSSCDGFCGINKSVHSRNIKELSIFMSKYDNKFNSFLNGSLTSGENFETFQSDLITSINAVIAETIEMEIAQSACFSWQVDTTTNASCFPQLSVIFRYVFQGKVIERFMGFFDVKEVRQTKDFIDFLKMNFDKFDLSNKLVGQTYDGASILSEQLNETQAKVKEIAPQALFMHCYAHRLNLILQDAASRIKECRIFFGNLVGFSSFFSESTKRTQFLDNLYNRRFQNDLDTRWNFKSKLIMTILNNRDDFLEVFEGIINSEIFQRDYETIREAIELKSMLNDFCSLFLLHTFNLIFQHTDILFSVTENKLSDMAYCISIIESLLSTIKKYRTEEVYYINIYTEVDQLLRHAPKRIKTESQDQTVAGSTYFKSIFNQILDLAIYQIDTRFQNMKSLKFFTLLDTVKFKNFERNFPQHLFDLLISNYPNLFDKIKLQNELRVLYSDSNFLGGSVNVNFQNMLTFIYSNSLHEDLCEVYKLLSIILSLPIMSAPTEDCIPVLKKIKTFCKNSTVDNFNVSTISIEKEFVKSLQSETKFYDKVIDHFASQKDRKIELFYKPS